MRVHVDHVSPTGAFVTPLSRRRRGVARGALAPLLCAALLVGVSPLRLADGTGGEVTVRQPPPTAPVTARAPAAERAAVAAVERTANTKRLEAALEAALDECDSGLSDRERRRIATVIVGAAARYGFDPLFVQAIVEVESTCSPTARGPSGSLGLIQIQPATARAVAARNGIALRGANALMRPEINVDVGLRYLVELEEQFADPYLAMAAYNLGPGRVAAMAMDQARARRSRYVRRILARYETLLRDFAEPIASRS